MTTPKLLSDAELKEIESAVNNTTTYTGEGLVFRDFAKALLVDRAALTAVPMEGEVEALITELAKHDSDYGRRTIAVLRNLQSALAKANGELNDARAALAAIKAKAGSHTVVPQACHVADPGFGGIYAVADAALHPNSEGQN